LSIYSQYALLELIKFIYCSFKSLLIIITANESTFSVHFVAMDEVEVVSDANAAWDELQEGRTFSSNTNSLWFNGSF